MGWVYLVAAGAFEIGFASALKASANFTRPLPSVVFLVCAILSFFLLTRAMLTIPLGTAYAVWTGIGAVGTVTIGILVFGEPATPIRLAVLGVLVAALIALKLVSA